MAFLILAASACSEDDSLAMNEVDDVIPADQSLISFTLSDANGRALTRAQATRAGFADKTDIIARFESYKSSAVGGVPSSERSDLRSTRTVLQAQPQASGKDYSEVGYLTTDYKRYWDNAFGRFANISVYAIAVPGKGNSLTNNNKSLLELVDYGGEAVSTGITDWHKEATGHTSSNDVSWTVSTTTGQNAETIANEDLCYSNNIQSDATLGKNGRYVWDFNADPQDYKPEPTGAATHANGHMRLALQNSYDKTSLGHFDKGHLVFRHALTRLTINFKRGAGFEDTSIPFAFTDPAVSDLSNAAGKNVKLNNVPVTGTLDMKTGTWSATASADIAKICETTAAAGYQHSLVAQFVPGYIFKEGNTTVNTLEYTIDGNTYYITPATIFAALTTGVDASNNPQAINQDEVKTDTGDNKRYIQMTQGKNYVINIKVNKTGIHNVTASIIDWVDIESAELAPENDYITITDMMGAQASSACQNFDLYRLSVTLDNIYSGGEVPVNRNWYSQYSDKATLTATGTAGLWKTNWYWESNQQFYHFRTVNSKTPTSIQTEGTGSDAKDYLSVTSGQLVDDTDATGYNDYHWGAPMQSGVTIKYDIVHGFNGADASGNAANLIYPAIGNTTSVINIIEHHMMSNVHVVLHTPTTDVTTSPAAINLNDNSVTLHDGTKAAIVSLNRFCKEGKVEMGRGVVNPTATVTDADQINAPSPYFTSRDVKDGSNNVVGSNIEDKGETNKYSYRVVPQQLDRTPATGTITDADKVGLTIETPDGNRYFVPQLSVIKAVTGTNTLHHKADEAVTRWYPGYDYTYHITLRKTGIEAITCSIIGWQLVETGNIDIGL